MFACCRCMSERGFFFNYASCFCVYVHIHVDVCLNARQACCDMYWELGNIHSGYWYCWVCVLTIHAVIQCRYVIDSVIDWFILIYVCSVQHNLMAISKYFMWIHMNLFNLVNAMLYFTIILTYILHNVCVYVYKTIQMFGVSKKLDFFF